MATNSVRAIVRAALTELLIEQADDTQVVNGWPGATLRDECVWVADITGTVTIPNMRTGRQSREDTFTVTVHFAAAKPSQSAEQACARVDEMYGWLENVLADNPSLGDLDGVRWAAQLGTEYEGPEPVHGTEGFEAFGTARFEVKTRLA